MNQFETDVLVIGSGVAGAIVAQECLNAGQAVLMLEAGSRTSGRALPLRFLEQFIRDYRIPRMRLWHHRARYRKQDYESVGAQGYDLSGRALVARGGATLGWGGDAYRLKTEDFRLGSLTGQGPDWPFDYEELEPYYVLGEKTLRVAGDHIDRGHPPRSRAFPFPAKPFDTRDKPFLDLLAAHDWSTMHHNSSMAFDGGAFTADELLDQLEKHPNFKLLTNSVATRILCSSKAHATAVECWNNGQGESFTVGAETIVVSAGGIETPNLLRLSENEWWPEGLGNHSNHLGRHLMSHGGIVIGGRPRGIRLLSGPVGPTAVTRQFDTGQEQAAGKYILLWRPAPSGYLFLNVVFEQFPNGDNTVKVGSKKTRFGTPAPIIDFVQDERYESRNQAICEHLETLAKQLNLKVNRRSSYLLAHPMGATRMSQNPSDGVVDADLRIHTMDNVYVCSSATFPTGGGVNPTMTIAALAHRLGAHLAQNGKTETVQSS